MSSSRGGKGAGIGLMLEGSHAIICYDEQQSLLFSISENLAPSTLYEFSAWNHLDMQFNNFMSVIEYNIIIIYKSRERRTHSNS